jgi:hypothetical protein
MGRLGGVQPPHRPKAGFTEEFEFFVRSNLRPGNVPASHS